MYIPSNYSSKHPISDTLNPPHFSVPETKHGYRIELKQSTNI